MKRDWVVWAGCVLLFLSGGVFFNLFPNGPSLIGWFNDNQGVAAWVQAVFSIVAIIAAASFPVLHEKARERRERRDVLVTLKSLALPLKDHLEKMQRAFELPSFRGRWVSGEGPKELLVMKQTLLEIPASMFVGFELSLLAEIRLAHSEALDVSNYLIDPGGVVRRGGSPGLMYQNSCKRCVTSLNRVVETIDGLRKACL